MALRAARTETSSSRGRGVAARAARTGGSRQRQAGLRSAAGRGVQSAAPARHSTARQCCPFHLSRGPPIAAASVAGKHLEMTVAPCLDGGQPARIARAVKGPLQLALPLCVLSFCFLNNRSSTKAASEPPGCLLLEVYHLLLEPYHLRLLLAEPPMRPSFDRSPTRCALPQCAAPARRHVNRRWQLKPNHGAPCSALARRSSSWWRNAWARAAAAAAANL